jgi:hypothetical protein
MTSLPLLTSLLPGILVLLALAFLTPLFYYIPDAALAAVIIMAVTDMIDFTMVPQLWRIRSKSTSCRFFRVASEYRDTNSQLRANVSNTVTCKLGRPLQLAFWSIHVAAEIMLIVSEHLV